MSQWKWWLVVTGLILSSGTGFGLFALERSKHVEGNGSTEVLSKRLAATEIEVEKLRLERQRIVEKASGMTRRLKVRTVKAATRNASGVFVEAVPYAGIPLMLAVTAADLYDACETMKEINALHASIGLEATDTDKVCGLSVPSFKQLSSKIKRHCGKSEECNAPDTKLNDLVLQDEK
jgi:hypothetical protein